MAETVTIAGRKFPKTGVYVAGAVTVGIVGYAWFTRGRAVAEEEPVEELPEPVEPPTDEPGFTVTGGGPPPGTNADWSELAKDRLIAIGIEPLGLSSAIGKFLARKPLNKTEADLVRQAISAAGYPPENGPWVIIEETPGSTVPPGGGPSPVVKPKTAPSSVRAVPGRHATATITWTKVPGATSYEIRRETRTTASGWVNVGNTLKHVATARVRTPTPYAWRVRGKNAAGVGPTRNSNTVRVLP